MTDAHVITGATDFALRKAKDAAKTRRDAALRRVSPNDRASFEAFKRADADYNAARERWAISINPSAKATR